MERNLQFSIPRLVESVIFSSKFIICVNPIKKLDSVKIRGKWFFFNKVDFFNYKEITYILHTLNFIIDKVLKHIFIFIGLSLGHFSFTNLFIYIGVFQPFCSAEP